MAGGLIHKIHLTPKRADILTQHMQNIWDKFGITKGDPNHALKYLSPHKKPAVAQEMRQAIRSTFTNNDFAKIKAFAKNDIKALFIDGIPYTKLKKEGTEGHLYASSLSYMPPRIDDWIAESFFLTLGCASISSPDYLQNFGYLDLGLRSHRDGQEDGKHYEKIILYGNKGLKNVETGISLSRDKKGESVCLDAGNMLIFDDSKVFHYVSDKRKNKTPSERVIFHYSSRSLRSNSLLL